MTENIVKIEAKGFQDICKKLAELEAENEQLVLENERLNRIKRGLMINNSQLTLERNDLIDELNSLKAMGVWEFANTYCTDEQNAEAGRQLARSLLGGK